MVLGGGAMALTATGSYLAAHHAGPLAPATAAVHGYSVAFTVSAALFAVGALVAIALLPSRRRMQELWSSAITGVAPAVGAAFESPSGWSGPGRAVTADRLDPPSHDDDATSGVELAGTAPRSI
jgi:hypothetical protein